jgi:putative cardiolipin synthase
VQEQATDQDYLALRKRLAEKISAAGYPYPIDEHLAGLRKRLLEIREAFVWAPGSVLVEDPARASGDDGEKVITEALLTRIRQTKREVLIESPYFILLDRGLEGLRQLTARGINVRVLTNSAATNDVIAAHAGYAHTRKDMLNAGVELYELRPDSNMEREWSIAAGRSQAALHAKALVFDRESAFIGSFNLDPRSRFINTEIGVMIESPEIARQLGEFMDDGVSPDSAFHVTLDEGGNLVWTTEANGKKVEASMDPETSAWQRFVINIIGLWVKSFHGVPDARPDPPDRWWLLPGVKHRLHI